MQIYAFTLNALIVATMPLTYMQSLAFLEALSVNRLMFIVNAVNLTQLNVLTALTIILRWKREGGILEMLTQLLDLECEYFEVSVPASLKRNCAQSFGKALLWTKYCSVVVQTCHHIYSFFAFTPSFDSLAWLYCAQTICVNGVLLHTVLHYFLTMWYVWERFCWLNAQLRRIFNLLLLLAAKEHHYTPGLRQRLQRRLAQELLDVARVHRRLTVLVERFTNCYHLQILTALISKVINNISIGYLSFKYGNNPNLEEFNALDLIISTVGFIFIISDSFLLDTLCDRLVNATRETAEMLKRFDELPEMDDAVENACFLLSQQLRQHQLRISILGMIDINKRLSFLVFGGLVKNILLLLQWDIGKQFDEK
ncbi:uncharacterized protein LOC118744371 [Rhagoletis pomonella]|uniref:uncharacterized protein LOC118744371 n=1 Tax=Rhagoletis pomonella TaxID=28610 RepID=UPI00177F4F24|nr:uncharacterized protein LOC118744371 [Rhagoletis pomonella]